MLTLSCFTDEAGEQNMDAGYYMATLVFHDQSKRFERFIDSYVARLQLEDLHDIPFHSVDLLHGHEDYEGLSVEKRKRPLVAFSMFVRTLPISYHTFSTTKRFSKIAINYNRNCGRTLLISFSTVSRSSKLLIRWQFTTMEDKRR